MTPYDAYNLFLSIRLHFNNQKYDYIHYNGKLKLSNKKLSENQIIIFNKIIKKYKSELLYFYVSNFFINQKLWINDLLSDDCEFHFHEWQKRNQALTYHFKNDIIFLLNEMDFNSLFKIEKSYPPLLFFVIRNQINIESFLILNKLLMFIQYWNKKLLNDLIWQEFHFRCIKYSSFVNIDEYKYKVILQNELKSNITTKIV